MSQPLIWTRIQAEIRRLLLHVGGFSAAMSILALGPAIYSLQVFDRVLNSRSLPTLVVLTVGVIATLLFIAFIDWARARVLGYFGSRVDAVLGPEVIEQVLESVVQPGPAGSAVSMRDVASLRQFLTGAGVLALFDAPWLLFYLLVMFLFHPYLGLGLLIGAAILIGLTWRAERDARPHLETLQGNTRSASRFLDDGIRNAPLLAAHGAIPGFVRHWQKRNALVLHAQNALGMTAARQAAAGRLVRQLLQSLMLGIAAMLAIDGRASPGIMIASTILLSRATQPLETLLAGWRQFIEARLAYVRVAAGFAERAKQLNRLELPAPRGRLEFERVVFAYKGASRPVLKGLSFLIEPGTVLAIIGPSGSGKSTLGKLACGLVPPTAGVVRLDGADVSQWPRAGLGPHLGYMPQAAELLAGTVAENIARFGELDHQQVVRAATRAGAHEFILSLPKGYDSLIGEGGMGLSGGEVQRIALARALYGDPKLVLLDEPNSHLDRDGDLALAATLKALKESGTTTLVVSHRPATMDQVDQVLVLKDGVAAMFGDKAQVLSKLGQRPQGAA